MLQPPPIPGVPLAYQISDQSTEAITSTLVSSKSSLSAAASSDGDSDSDSDSAGESDSDDTTDSETTDRLRDLFLKAKASAREKAQAATADASGSRSLAAAQANKGDSLAGQDEVVFFGGEGSDDDDAAEGGATPTASSSRSALPASLVRPVHLKAPTAASSFAGPANESSKGKAPAARSGGISLAQDLAGAIDGGAVGDKWGQAPRRKLSKKERQSRNPRTAGPKWFNMPATELTPDVKREIQAMRLRNALDPKRFYKGGAKDDKKLPEFFSLGHVLASTASASTANPAAARKRTFVEELVDDEQARAYTKRKTSEVMARGMSGRARQKKGGKAKDGRVPRS